MNIELKVEPMNEVFYMHDNRVKSDEVEEVRITVKIGAFSTIQSEVKYSLAHVSHRLFSGDEIFLNRQDLLNSL